MWSRVTWPTTTVSDSLMKRLPWLPGSDQHLPGILGCWPWEYNKVEVRYNEEKHLIGNNHCVCLEEY